MSERHSMQAAEAIDSGAPGRRARPWQAIPAADRWAYAALALLVVFTALRPGDAGFVSDEPILLHWALHANQTPWRWHFISLPFSLPAHGMLGTRGAFYGPAPVWFYQAMLALTHDPIKLVAIRALLTASITAISLAWLARTLRMTSWLAVIVMCSPWLWYYHRGLWDNSLCIPLSALALAAYADFLARNRGKSLLLAVACCGFMALIHFMSVALIVPLALHAMIFGRHLSKRVWKRAAALVVLFVLMGLPYARYFVAHYHLHPPIASSGAAPWLFALLGAHHLAALDVNSLLGADWMNALGPGGAAIARAAQYVSLLAYVAVWAGMALAAARVTRWIRSAAAGDVVDHVALISLGVLLAQTLLDGWENLWGYAHYYNATWAIYVVFAWLAAEALLKSFPRLSWVKWVMVAQGASLLIVLVGMIAMLEIDGGTRKLEYGTILSNQAAVVKELDRYPARSPLQLSVTQWIDCPEGLATLRELFPPQPSEPAKLLVVRYRLQFPADAKIVVNALPLTTPGATGIAIPAWSSGGGNP